MSNINIKDLKTKCEEYKESARGSNIAYDIYDEYSCHSGEKLALDKIFNPIKYKNIRERRENERRDRCNNGGQHNRDAMDRQGTDNLVLDSRRCLERAYGDLLKQLDEKVSFCWYATLTFKEPVHPESANKRFNRWICKLNKEAFGKRYKKRGQGVKWVRALEWQKRGVIHFHSLIADIPEKWNSKLKDLRRLHWMDEWYKTNGIARIYEYDKRLGACYYLGKYISKGGEIDIGGEWKSIAMQQTNLKPSLTLPFGRLLYD